MGLQKIKAGVLGATGVVGQRLLRRLENHPWFEVAALGASERSRGAVYGEQVRWTLQSDIPKSISEMKIRECTPESFEGCRLIFSSLASGVAREVEGNFAASGFNVVSNSSAYRMDDNVPLVVPEINANHLEIGPRQCGGSGGGWIVTNPNCSVIGLALVLAPLHTLFGVEKIVVTTMQALSGAGLSGPSLKDMIDNVLPNIDGEENKIEQKLPKILGSLQDSGPIRPAEIAVSAHCNRVATVDGHLETVSVKLSRPATMSDVEEALRSFRGEIEGLDLPSAPGRPIVVTSEPDRPQPRLDRETGDGMTVVVGRIRPCPVFDLRMTLLSHNAERGAAGAALMNAELLAVRGMLGSEVPA